MNKDTAGSVIMPVSGYNSVTLYMSLVGLRTLRATTCAEVLIVGNNTPDLSVRKSIEAECDLLGCRWHYMDGPFSITKTFNWGFDNTKGEYMAHCGADAIFYPNWFHNLIDVWEMNPRYFTLAPMTFHRELTRFHPFMEHPVAGILETHIHCPAVSVVRRSQGWRYDELSEWECDSDLGHHISKHRLREGWVLNSRVDHMHGTHYFRNEIPIDDPRFYARTYQASAEYLWDKWGLTKPTV